MVRADGAGGVLVCGAGGVCGAAGGCGSGYRCGWRGGASGAGRRGAGGDRRGAGCARVSADGGLYLQRGAQRVYPGVRERGDGGRSRGAAGVFDVRGVRDGRGAGGSVFAGCVRFAGVVAAGAYLVGRGVFVVAGAGRVGVVASCRCGEYGKRFGRAVRR